MTFGNRVGTLFKNSWKRWFTYGSGGSAAQHDYVWTAGRPQSKWTVGTVRDSKWTEGSPQSKWTIGRIQE